MAQSFAAIDEWNLSGSVIDGMPTCPYGFPIFQVKDNKNAARSHPISQSYKPKCKMFCDNHCHPELFALSGVAEASHCAAAFGRRVFGIFFAKVRY